MLTLIPCRLARTLNRNGPVALPVSVNLRPMNWIKKAFGAGAAPTEAAQAPVACYPDDVDFEDGPCSGCEDPCSVHKQVGETRWGVKHSTT